MKILLTFTRFLFIVAIPMLAFSASIAVAINSPHFYVARFDKYNVKQSLAEAGIAVDDIQVQGIAVSFIHYFNSSDDFIHLTVMQNGKSVNIFNDEEIIHFRDVKGLFILDYKILVVCLLYCLIYGLAVLFWQHGKYRLQTARDLVIGGGLTLGLMLLLGIGFAIDFNALWVLFHEISFSNIFWSTSGNMLLLFPDGFWIDAVRYCVLFAATLAVIVSLAGWVFIRFYKRKTS